MYLLLKRGVLFLLIFFLLDHGVGALLRHFYFRQTSGDMYRLTFSLEETEADLIVFGTSRANHHYVPSVLEEGLGVTCYNTGRDGSSILSQAAILVGILDRYEPRIVVLDLNEIAFFESKTNYARLSALLPYYRRHPEIRPILLLRGRFERWKLLSWTYPFNSTLLGIVTGNLGSDRGGEGSDRGYVPLHGKWPRVEPWKYEPKSVTIDSNLVRRFEWFVEETTRRGIRCYVIASPLFREPGPDSPTYEIARRICEERAVPFWNFTHDKRFLERPDLFKDPNHLNHEGSLLFTGRVVEKIIEEEGKAGG